MSVLTANEKVLKNALDSEIIDYEDAVIDELVSKEKLDFIITRDMKDFKKSNNTIYTAIEALEILNNEGNGTA